MEQTTYTRLVGIDWAQEAHQVCVLTPEGTLLQERSVEHNAVAIQRFVDGLLQQVERHAERVAVAIETPRGTLVEALLEGGLSVYALNPKQLDRFRDRHGMSGAKDDRRDAYVLADALRSDRHKFRRVQPDSRLLLQIRELSRLEDDLREESNRLTNRLREQIYRCASPLLNLSPAADEPWFWELAEGMVQGKRWSRAQTEKLLKRHRIRRLCAEEIQAALRSPRVRGIPGASEAAGRHIRLLVPRLRLIREQRQDCTKQLQVLLEEYDAEDAESRDENGPGDLEILRSLPGVGLLVTSRMVAEAAALLRRRDYRGLRAFAGAAPVTRRSGKSLVVGMRYGCNHRLRTALYHWARTSTQNDAAARAYYAELRARGHSHGRALRSVADRWLRILMAMLNARTLYDPHYQRRVQAAA
jgi:transposase